MAKFKAYGIELPPGDFGIPADDPARPGPKGKGRWGVEATQQTVDLVRPAIGQGRVVNAGGMVYVNSVGPVDPATGLIVGGSIKDQTRQCLANLKAKLEAAGSSLDKVVWANWSLKDATEFDTFFEEWLHWFPADGPVGQGTVLPPVQRRAGFRISIGVIAEA
jgi:2-iminobutanoate/2-iminopropanoate deaminase